MSEWNIKGTITAPDGTESQFLVDSEGLWSQWGASVAVLGTRVALLDAIGGSVFELLYQPEAVEA